MPIVDLSTCGVGDVATFSCIPSLLQVVVFWALVFAGVAAIFLVIYAGYKFMTSGGDPKALDGARKTLTYGILGLVLIFMSFFIIDLIAYITGVSCITNFDFGKCFAP